ncbi:MAG: type II toxin-antitoxin system YafQ family toxin [Bacteroidales bacterium]|nr:type II toxin-antitoxin system YafQ family toxin [Bacteroidales bacterium]
MKEFRTSTQFKKDLKRYKNQPSKLRALNVVLEMLQNDIPLPAEYRAHFLLGDYKGCLECHIQGDFLLVWMDMERNLIELVRLGSHSELFG